MNPWDTRPIEVAHLLNPAFCGEVLRRSIVRHYETSAGAFPYPLIFLVLPIVLHRKTRESISPNIREHLHVWLQAHQDVRVDFAERAEQLVPISRESLTFLLQVGSVTADSKAGLLATSRQRRTLSGQDTGEVADCFRKAEIVGRWFARAGTPTTIFTMWGVRP